MLTRSYETAKKRIFVPGEDERIIGFYGATKYNRSTGTIGYGAAVLPGFRKRGIGSMLLLTAFRWLKKSGVRLVTLEEETSSFENKYSPAIILYKSLGGMIIKDQPVTTTSPIISSEFPPGKGARGSRSCT